MSTTWSSQSWSCYSLMLLLILLLLLWLVFNFDFSVFLNKLVVNPEVKGAEESTFDASWGFGTLCKCWSTLLPWIGIRWLQGVVNAHFLILLLPPGSFLHCPPAQALTPGQKLGDFEDCIPRWRVQVCRGRLLYPTPKSVMGLGLMLKEAMATHPLSLSGVTKTLCPHPCISPQKHLW